MHRTFSQLCFALSGIALSVLIIPAANANIPFDDSLFHHHGRRNSAFISENVSPIAESSDPFVRTRKIAIVGKLNPALEAGRWTVTDRRTRQKYVLLKIGTYRGLGWFQQGMRVRIEGITRPDIANRYMEGTALVVHSMEPLSGQRAQRGDFTSMREMSRSLNW